MNEIEQTTDVSKKTDADAPTGSAEINPGSFTASSLVMDIRLQIHVRMGRAQLSLREITELGNGSVVELDGSVDDPVEILVNDRIVAEGELVIVEGKYGVRVTRIANGGDSPVDIGSGPGDALRRLSERLK